MNAPPKLLAGLRLRRCDSPPQLAKDDEGAAAVSSIMPLAAYTDGLAAEALRLT